MTTINLTAEQQQVVQHPIRLHARILAVAGSGTSLTLAYHIKHLERIRNTAAEIITSLEKEPEPIF